MEAVDVCAREDQAVCAQLQKDYPDVSYALCYLYGVLRGSGETREVALRETLAQVDRSADALPT